MAISATALNNNILEALSDYNNGDYKNDPKHPQHLKIMGDTMKDYFEANIEITYTWAATLPPPASTPDPVKSFKSAASFPAFDLTSAHGLPDLALLIQAAFIGAEIKHPSGFSVKTGTFLVSAPPPLVTTPTGDNAILMCICVPVCPWVLTLINPAPLAGKHGSYEGATTGMVIA
jgi:hypothetical protein